VKELLSNVGSGGGAPAAGGAAPAAAAGGAADAPKEEEKKEEEKEESDEDMVRFRRIAHLFTGANLHRRASVFSIKHLAFCLLYVFVCGENAKNIHKNERSSS
jgi:hypothetical protein